MKLNRRWEKFFNMGVEVKKQVLSCNIYTLIFTGAICNFWQLQISGDQLTPWTTSWATEIDGK